MASPRTARRLLLASIAALALAVAGAGALGYACLSNRATRWGDHLIVGPRFSGEVVLDGGERITVERENGVPALDAPSWKGRGPFYVTFIWGFAVYHTPPGTLYGGNGPAP